MCVRLQSARHHHADLPLKLHIQDALTNSITHLVDCTRDWHGELNDNEVASLQQHSIAELPEITRPKTAIGVPYVMNLCILKAAEARYDIIIHFNFMFNETLRLENAISIALGQPLVIYYWAVSRSAMHV